MVNMLKVAAVLPLVLAFSAFGLWRSLMPKPWGFLIVALILSYVVMAAAVVYALQGIGIAGDPNRAAPSFGPVERRIALLLLVYVIVGFVGLFGVSFLFRNG